jgi:hypothetical protein
VITVIKIVVALLPSAFQYRLTFLLKNTSCLLSLLIQQWTLLNLLTILRIVDFRGTETSGKGLKNFLRRSSHNFF